MKTINCILLLLAVFLFSGCDNNSEPKDKLEGSWKLIKTIGGLAGQHYDFPQGMITWDFDSDAKTVTIINNNPDENAYDVFESGTYEYSLEPNTTTTFCTKTLVINELDQGCYAIAIDEMVLSQQVSDGYMLHFVR